MHGRTRGHQAALLALSTVLVVSTAGCKKNNDDGAQGGKVKPATTTSMAPTTAMGALPWTGTVATDYARSYVQLIHTEHPNEVLDGAVTYTDLVALPSGVPERDLAGMPYSAVTEGGGSSARPTLIVGDPLCESTWTVTGRTQDTTLAPPGPVAVLNITDVVDPDTGVLRGTAITPLPLRAVEESPCDDGDRGAFTYEPGRVVPTPGANIRPPDAPIPDDDPDPLHLVGSVTYTLTSPPFPFSQQDLVAYSYKITYDLRRFACPDTPVAPPGDPADCDNDRLPNGFETGFSHTNPLQGDTDGDGFLDPTELAAGSDPMNPTETPDNLPAGAAQLPPGANGNVGITCGKTTFEWVTPALEPIGVGEGADGCILLLSNEATNGIIDTVLNHATDVSTELAALAGTYAAEAYGDEAVDWAVHQADDVAVWAAKSNAKKALLKALSLTRINYIFTAGQIAGLAAVPIAVNFAFDQIREDNACIEVQLGQGGNENTVMSWHLVYSSEHTTDADLSYAGARRQVDKSFRPDGTESVRSNLRCAGGVVTGDGSASALFAGPVTAIF